MIALASECMLFRLPNEELLPVSVANIAIEISCESQAMFDSEFVRHAANAVFHYFKYELGRQTVSVGEFSEALEKVLSGFAVSVPEIAHAEVRRAGGADLRRMADEAGKNSELFFFSRLRDEVRRQLKESPKVLRFRGLRSCVKRLTGARRWSSRCRKLEEQILDYLRKCLSAEAGVEELSLVVQ